MEVLQVCGIIKQLIFIHFYLDCQSRLLQCYWAKYNFILCVDSLDLFISFCIYNVGIIC